MPPSVKVVDELLTGLETEDVERAVNAVHPDDRALLRKGMSASSRTELEALAIPPRPLEHEMVEIADKQADHHVVVADLKLKNPLPFASERMGQEMPDMPKTRPLTLRFRAEKLPNGDWAVRLDLPATLARSQFVQRFQTALDEGRLDDAEAMLSQIPPSPVTPQAQIDADRLAESLLEELESVRRKAAKGTPNQPSASPKTPPEAQSAP